MKSKFLFFVFAFLIIANTSNAQVSDIDGHQYKTVKIGKQVWMAENLNVSHFRNGDIIPESKDWVTSEDGKPAWCYNNNDITNGKKYGKLYNWNAAKDPRGLAPKGWHIPTVADWKILTKYLGGENVAGGKLKSTYGWVNKGYYRSVNNGNGINESGFAALPGGSRDFDLEFGGIGELGFWWSASANNTGYGWFCILEFENSKITMDSTPYARNGYSVRCVKD